MATGDITACRILATGWEAEIDIAGLSAGGTYAMDGSGATLTDTSTAKVVFTVVSEGYNASGVLGTKTRTVYGTRARMKAYPNQTAAEEAVADGTLTVTLALSDYIYDDDNTGAGKSGTAPTVTISSGFYTEAAGDGGTASNATTDLTVTNNSTQDYPTVIARWAVVPYQRVTSTFDLEVVAFHRHSENGKPVACVVFSHTDASTDAVVSTEMVKSSAADSLPCYRRTITASNYTDDTVYDWHFSAYPWIGDADSVQTTVGGTANTLDLGPLPLLMDADDDYGVTYAYVNTGAADDNGTASRTAATAAADPFQTIRAALAAIQAVNNGLGRNNSDCGVIRLQSDDHSWGDGTGSATTTNSWVTITRDPDVAKADARIVGAPQLSLVTEKVRLYDITLVPTGIIGVGGTGRALWLDTVHNEAATQVDDRTFVSYPVTYNTDCTAHLISYPWANYSTANRAALIRHCSATMAKSLSSSAGAPSCLLTTTLDHGNSLSNLFAYACADNWIMAYCQDLANPSPTSSQLIVTGASNNLALVCNLFEDTEGDDGPTLVIHVDTDVLSTTNVLLWHNTVVGNRLNFGYNTTADQTRTLSSLKYNAINRLAIKQDVFNSDGTLISAWASLYGVGWLGNHHEDPDVNFLPNYYGLGSTIGSDAGYTDDQSWWASDPVKGGGNGDYTTTEASVLRGKIGSLEARVIPWDIAGNAYVAGGAAGAYTFTVAGGHRFWTYA